MLYYTLITFLFLTLGTLAAPVMAQESPLDPETTALDRFAAGQIHESQGEFAQALAAYEEAAEVLQDSPTLYLSMARCAMMIVDTAKVRDYASRAAELDPGNAEAHFLYGQARYRLGEREEALASLRRAATLDSTNVGFGETLAAFLEREGELADAVEVLERLKRHHPFEPRVLRPLGTLYLELGEAGPAVENLSIAAREEEEPGILARLGAAQEMAGLFDDAIASYERALELNPQDQQVRWRLIDGLIGAGRLEAALRQVKTLAYLNPDDPQVQSRLAVVAYGTGELDDARRALERLEALGPLGVDLLTMKADLLRRQGDLEGASGAVEKALAEDGDNPRARLLAARLALRAGRPEAAEDHVRRALARFPESPELRYTLAQVLAQREDFAGALEILDDLREADPGNLEVTFSRAVVLQQAGRFDDAVAGLRAVLEQRPDHDAALNYLGYMYADRGENLEEAHALIKRAVELDPENGSYVDSLGWVLYRLGRLEEGREALARAAELTEDPVVLEHLGDCLLALGRSGDARERYRRAIELGGEAEGLQEKIRRAGADRSEKPEPPDNRGVERGEESTP